MQNKVYIIDAKRTALCVCGGSLKTVTEQDLCAETLKSLEKAHSSIVAQADELIIGVARQTSNPSNCARFSSLLAKLPEKLPSYTVTNQSLSGLQAVVTASNAISAGLAATVITGGAESASLCPLEIHNVRFSFEEEQRIITTALKEQERNAQPHAEYGKLSLAMLEEKINEKLSAQQKVKFTQTADKLNFSEKSAVSVSVRVKKDMVDISKDDSCSPKNGVAPYGDGAVAFLLSSTEADGALGTIDAIKEIAFPPTEPDIASENLVANILEKASISGEFVDLAVITAPIQALTQVGANALVKADVSSEKIVVYLEHLPNAQGATSAAALCDLAHSLKDCGKKCGLLLSFGEGGQAIAIIVKAQGGK